MIHTAVIKIRCLDHQPIISNHIFLILSPRKSQSFPAATYSSTANRSNMSVQDFLTHSFSDFLLSTLLAPETTILSKSVDGIISHLKRL